MRFRARCLSPFATSPTHPSLPLLPPPFSDLFFPFQNVRRRQSRMEREVDNLEDDLAAARANVGPPPSPLRILQGVRELQRSLIDD